MAIIKGFKLANGDEIIGTLVQTLNANELILKQVRLVGYSPDGRISTMPYSCLQQDGQIHFSINAIAAEFTVPKQAEDGYLQEVSGIALAKP